MYDGEGWKRKGKSPKRGNTPAWEAVVCTHSGGITQTRVLGNDSIKGCLDSIYYGHK